MSLEPQITLSNLPSFVWFYTFKVWGVNEEENFCMCHYFSIYVPLIQTVCRIGILVVILRINSAVTSEQSSQIKKTAVFLESDFDMLI